MPIGSCQKSTESALSCPSCPQRCVTTGDPARVARFTGYTVTGGTPPPTIATTTTTTTTPASLKGTLCGANIDTGAYKT